MELDPFERKIGLRMRKVEIVSVKKPDDHGYTMNGRFHPVDHVMCDQCQTPIHNGTKAIAVTQWRKDREPQPQCWEHLFGAI